MKNHDLITGSFVLLVAFGLYGVINFIFQLTMARMLDVSEYGVLATIFSIIYFFSVFTESIQIIVSKYSSSEKSDGQVKNILKRTLKKSLFLAAILFLVYLILIIPLSKLLDIKYSLLFIGGISLLFSILLPNTRGVMQGRKRFKAWGINLFLESVIKLFLAVIFVYLGFQIYGALIGILIGFFIAFVLSIAALRDIFESMEQQVSVPEIRSYAKPAFFITLITILFYNLDIILVRILFSSEYSGIYAIASVISKAIFWGTQPISKAMFPLSAENHMDKRKSRKIFLNSLSILIGLIVIALGIFYFFPEFVVMIFSGRVITESASLLIYLGIGVSLISIANLILIYKLSLGKFRNFYYLFVFVVVEIFLMFYFSASLIQFSLAFVVSSAIFLLGTILLIRE